MENGDSKAEVFAGWSFSEPINIQPDTLDFLQSKDGQFYIRAEADVIIEALCERIRALAAQTEEGK